MSWHEEMEPPLIIDYFKELAEHMSQKEPKERNFLTELAQSGLVNKLIYSYNLIMIEKANLSKHLCSPVITGKIGMPV